MPWLGGGMACLKSPAAFLENVLQPGSDTPMLARFSSMADDIVVANTESDERCLF